MRGGCTPCWPADYEIVPEEVQASRATKPEKNKRRLRHSCSISSFHLAAFQSELLASVARTVRSEQTEPTTEYEKMPELQPQRSASCWRRQREL